MILNYQVISIRKRDNNSQSLRFIVPLPRLWHIILSYRTICKAEFICTADPSSARTYSDCFGCSADSYSDRFAGSDSCSDFDYSAFYSPFSAERNFTTSVGGTSVAYAKGCFYLLLQCLHQARYYYAQKSLRYSRRLQLSLFSFGDIRLFIGKE